jgi:cytochrome c oxidase cbb3-type subunit IV
MQLFGVGLDTWRGIVLILLVVGFLGMWAWAWSRKRQATFHEASLLPLEEDEGEIPIEGAKE